MVYDEKRKAAIMKWRNKPENRAKYNAYQNERYQKYYKTNRDEIVARRRNKLLSTKYENVRKILTAFFKKELLRKKLLQNN
jgi:hypothetical protein